MTVGVSAESGGSDVTDQTAVEPFGDPDLDGVPDVTEFDISSFDDILPFRHQLDRHRAVLTDLEPDTRYGITIEGSNTDLVVRTASEELIDSLTFAEGGDIGTSSSVSRMHEQAAGWDRYSA